MRVGTMIALAAGVAIVYVAATRRSSGAEPRPIAISDARRWLEGRRR